MELGNDTQRFSLVIIVGFSALIAIVMGTLIVFSTYVAVVVTVTSLCVSYVLFAPPTYKVAAALILLVSGFVDLPRYVSFGPVTGGGVATMVLAVLMAPAVYAFAARSFRRQTASDIAGMLFLYWAVFSTVIRFDGRIAIFQNLLVYAIFVTAVPIVRNQLGSGVLELRQLERLFTVSSVFSVALFVAGYMITTGGDNYLVTPRSFAIFALMCIAWTAPRAKNGSASAVILCTVLLMCMAASLSRTATVAAILIMLFVWVNPRRPRTWIVVIALGFAAWKGALWAINNVEPLRDRFFTGDVSMAVGGIKVNSSGRTEMWNATLDSWNQDYWSKLLGKGAGSVTEVIPLVVPGQSHPHNDYLRILHDFGLVGLGIWFVWMIFLLVPTLIIWSRSHKNRDDMAYVHYSAVLAIAALSMTMFTDNTIVYYFAVIPVAVAVGCSQHLRIVNTVTACESDGIQVRATIHSRELYAHS